ncbi:MAG: STAS/SEC14 domain-containing protein [Polyangiales bacterium]|nr:STAS/SEC14 domain-containing protein [Sandaracinaceae bacterium]
MVYPVATAQPTPSFGAIRCFIRPGEPRLVEFTYADGFTIDDFRGAMEFVARYTGQHRPIAILSEVRGTVPAGAADRRRMADIVRDHDQAAGHNICASAVVTDSTLMRGVLTAVSWIHATPYELRAFSDDDQARAWLRERLAGSQRG